MNNKSKQKNKSLQKGLFFAISSELEKAIGRKADWAAGAEIDDDSDSEDQAKAKRKKYADRFGSGEVSDKEFEEDEKKPVQYRPKAGADAQDVRTKDERDTERASAKLFREQKYGTKGKEPVRESAEKRNRKRFLSSKFLPDDTEITSEPSLTDSDRKQYRQSMEYAPRAESAEDRVWRNIRGGMTYESFTDPEDRAAYGRLSERFRDSNAGKSAKAATERRAKEGPDTIENSAPPEPTRAPSTYSYDRRDLDRIDAGKPPAADVLGRLKARAEKRAGRGSGPDDIPPADPKSAGPTPDEISLGRANAFGGVARVARRDRRASPNFLKPSTAGSSPADRTAVDEDAERVRLAADRERAERDIARTAAGKKTYADIVPDRFARNPDGTTRVVTPTERAISRRGRYNPEFAEAAYPKARPISPPATTASSGADLGTDAAEPSVTPHIPDRSPPPPLGKSAGRGLAVLRGERGLLRNSLRNIEKDANRLSKAVNKSFKKKH